MAEVRARLPFPVGLTVAVAISLMILMALGVWQLQRMDWKRNLLVELDSARAAPAVMLSPGLLEPADIDRDAAIAFRKVMALCPGLSSAPFVQLFGVVDGEPGWRLVSACPMEGLALPVLVERGFIAQTIEARPQILPDDGRPVAVRGYLRDSEQANLFSAPSDPAAGKFHSRDVEGMARALGLQAAASRMMVAETSSNPDLPALVPTGLPPAPANNHLSYALTWFGLAAVLVGVYAAMLRRRTRTQ